ncbi:hypothetical protein J4438_03965 [Candidatus Woesearchaeota archaeon]|nr:hypothetical protein [Candidatus Woesearchaeota archaeon]
MSKGIEDVDLTVQCDVMAASMKEGIEKMLDSDFVEFQIPERILTDAISFFDIVKNGSESYVNDTPPLSLKSIVAYRMVKDILKITYYRIIKDEDIPPKIERLAEITRSLENPTSAREHSATEYQNLAYIFGEIARLGSESRSNKSMSGHHYSRYTYPQGM